MRRSSLLSTPQVHRATSYYIQTRLLIPYDLFAFGKSREKINTFNSIIHFDLPSTCKDGVCVNGFEKFACNHELAEERFKKFDKKGLPDTLYFNKSGVRLLAELIKQSVFIIYNIKWWRSQKKIHRQSQYN